MAKKDDHKHERHEHNHGPHAKENRQTHRSHESRSTKTVAKEDVQKIEDRLPEHAKHGAASHKGHAKQHCEHHGHMVADFRKRFWISLIVTIPILFLSLHVRMPWGWQCPS